VKALKRTILPVVCLALMLSSASRAMAQAAKPMAVVSVTSIDNLFGSLKELAAVAGFSNEFKAIDINSPRIKPLLNGIDTSKPSGVIVRPGAGLIPDILAFIPVKNLKTLVTTLQGVKVPISDAGGGTYEIAAGFFTIVVKESKGYAFIATNKDLLAKLPANPAALLEGMDKKYAYGVRLNIQAVPAKMRDQLQGQISTAMKNALANPGIDAELAKRMQESYEKAVKMLIQESESITFGLGINRKEKSAFIDFELTAVPNSKFAKQIAASSDVKTNFAGFDQADAAGAITLTSKIVPEEIASAKAVLAAFGQKMLAELDADDNVDKDAKGPVKEFAKSMLDLVTKTIETGKIDGGAVVVLKPKSLQLVAGGHVADGKALEAAIRKLVKAAQADKSFPKITFNASKHGDVTFHVSKFTVPADDEDAQRILGKELEIALGIGPKTAYFGMGTDCVGLITKIIDQSKQGAKKVIPGFKLRASIGQILNFVKSIDDDPTVAALAAAATKSKGMDNVIVQAGLQGRTIQYQIKIEQGVIRVIGAAAGAILGR